MDEQAKKKPCLPAVTPVEFNILVSLVLGARHGLGLIQDIADRTENEIFLSPGTLYSALKRMAKSGWIEPSENTLTVRDGNQERRSYYSLTEDGSEMILAEVERMERVAAETRKLLAQGGSGNEGNSQKSKQKSPKSPGRKLVSFFDNREEQLTSKPARA